MFKVNNRNTRTRCEIWSKLTIKTPERRYFTPCSSVFVVNFELVNAGLEDIHGFKSTGRVSSFFFVLTRIVYVEYSVYIVFVCNINRKYKM